MSDEPKIIVDEDFKEQVEREKEEARRKAAAKHLDEGAEHASLPPASFESLVALLGTQAMAYLGVAPTEEANLQINLPLARFHIDLLELLQEKTRMNLTGIESDALKNWLFQLRMLYVETSKLGNTSNTTRKDLDSDQHQASSDTIYTP